jgi:hypothetical protein
MVIPLFRAGHPRITHPFATSLLSKGYSKLLPFNEGSFDLHVLGTPLAFILSQDQTLRKKFLTVLTQSIRDISCHSSVVKVRLSERAGFYHTFDNLSNRLFEHPAPLHKKTPTSCVGEERQKMFGYARCNVLLLPLLSQFLDLFTPRVNEIDNPTMYLFYHRLSDLSSAVCQKRILNFGS